MIRHSSTLSPPSTWLEAPLRPFILIDTRIVGGPGKGLFQFLRHAPREAANQFEPTLAHFTYPGGALTEFERRAGELGIPRVGIETRTPLDRAAFHHALALIRARGANIIQSHGYKSHLYAFMLRRLTGIPWVAFAHGWTAENLKVRLYHLIDRAVLPSADTVVAVSATLQRMIARWRSADRPTELIYNAVSPGDFDPQPPREPVRASLRIPPDALVIGCFGRLSREKGHVHLLHAFNTLAHHRPNAFLLVLGDGPEKAALTTLRAALPCGDRIIFAPHRSNAAPFYEAIDILALPSLSEGLPNVVLEALVFGKPVVATAVGAVGAVVESGVTGFVVPPGDSRALAAALARLVDSPELRGSFAEAARPSLYPRFCPAHRARRILGVYQALIPPVLNAAPRIGLSSCSENHLYL